MAEEYATPPLRVNWAAITPKGDRPTPRGGHTAVAADASLVVFGGHAYVGESKFAYYNDTHLFDAESGMWHHVRCSGEVPLARYGHSAVLVGSRMFIFGGKGESGLLRDMHFLDLDSWAWVPVSSTTAGPSPRLNHATALVGRKMVVHGGWDGAESALSDLWVFDTEAFTWMSPVTAGLPPSPRYGHDMQLLEDGRLVLYGGLMMQKGGASPEYHKDLRQLDTESMVWSRQRASAEVYPSGRYAHTLTLMGGQLFLFGGWGLGGLQSSAENKRQGAESVFSFDCQSELWWRPALPTKPLEHKYGHTATVLGQSLFIFGGWSGKQASNSLVELVFQPV